MTSLKLLISKEKIAARIREVAAQMRKDYTGKDLVIVLVLKGALCFVADLIQEIDLPFTLETVQCSSYGPLGKERGPLTVMGTERLSLRQRDVLLVDDIFESGHTLSTLLNILQTQQPRSIKTCVLLDKKNVPRVTSHSPHYVLFPIDNLFVVGYGLDFKEQYRGLPGIYVLETS